MRRLAAALLLAGALLLTMAPSSCSSTNPVVSPGGPPANPNPTASQIVEDAHQQADDCQPGSALSHCQD